MTNFQLRQKSPNYTHYHIRNISGIEIYVFIVISIVISIVKAKPKASSTSKAAKRRSKGSAASRSCSAEPPAAAPAHYRLRLATLPFCVGQATTPSHSLASNIQHVFSLLKQHHPKLCNSRPDCGANDQRCRFSRFFLSLFSASGFWAKSGIQGHFFQLVNYKF